MAKKYIIVRSYHNGNAPVAINSLLEEGYQFVHASEFVPAYQDDRYNHYGYIEYVLCKEVEDG